MIAKEPRYAELFQGLPLELDEVNARIVATEAQMGQVQVDPKAKEQYDAMAAKEARLKDEVAAGRRNIDDKSKDFNAKVRRLQTELQRHSHLLSMRFSNFMARIKCQGRITLVMDPSDIKSCASLRQRRGGGATAARARSSRPCRSAGARARARAGA